jgi:hypothetical protein
MSLKTKPTTNWPRNPDKPSPFDPLDSELPCLTLNSPITDYVKWLKYAQEELVHSNHNSDVVNGEPHANAKHVSGETPDKCDS